MLVEEREDIEMEGQDVSNDDSNQQRVLIDFQEVINEDGSTMTQEILEAEEVDSESISTHTGARIQIMEIDDSQQEMSEVVDTVMGKVEEPDMEVLQSDSLPRIEITAAENEAVHEYMNEDDTKKIEPDTEAVSEDELPTEAAAKVRNIRFTFSIYIINVLSAYCIIINLWIDINTSKCTGTRDRSSF